MTKQQIKYQQKLEDRSRGIQACELTKKGIQESLRKGFLENALRKAENLNWMARCYLNDKIGAKNNFNGYVKYSRKILRMVA